MTIAEFSDPRLIAIYDTVNPYAEDAQPRFYRELAAELAATTIVDLGCGTGLITCDLARRGYQVIGVEPSPAMLAVARRRADCPGVRWIDGDATRIGTLGADLAIMTGHVAQFFVSDDSWLAALTGLHAALRPAGALAFETRDPRAREWEHWNHQTGRAVEDPDAGPIETWSEVFGVRDGVLSYANHYRFLMTGEVVTAPMQLRFRTDAELESSLAAAGFTVDRVFGNWERHPPGARTKELIVVAARDPGDARGEM